jgi:hypothetical protein
VLLASVVVTWQTQHTCLPECSCRVTEMRVREELHRDMEARLSRCSKRIGAHGKCVVPWDISARRARASAMLQHRVHSKHRARIPGVISEVGPLVHVVLHAWHDVRGIMHAASQCMGGLQAMRTLGYSRT